MAATAEDLLLLYESGVKSQATRFARRLGAASQAVEFERLKPRGHARRLLVYLHGGEPPDAVKAVLRKVSATGYETIVLYSAERAPQTAAKWGMVLGETQPKRAHLCFDPGEVAEILHLKPKPAAKVDIAAIRKQLGLTQEQLAAALKLSPRTIQNWESGAGLSQMEKRTRDLMELFDLLNDYVPVGQQAEWMRSPSNAFAGRAPLDLLFEGKVRDVILEFRRLQAGQPL
jgi:DNA-binding transcriptional regulator YiaG